MEIARIAFSGVSEVVVLFVSRGLGHQRQGRPPGDDGQRCSPACDGNRLRQLLTTVRSASCGCRRKMGLMLCAY